MPKFGDLKPEQQTEIAEKIGACLKEHDLASVKVDIYREEVCQITAEAVDGKTLMKVEKQLPSSDEEKAEKFKAAVKAITEGYEDITIKVDAAVGAGDKYRTITEVTTLDAPDAPVSIEHKPGEVLLIDFWATWCPPCQKPMAHNEEMLKEMVDTWGDKVKIIGLSIDGDAATVAAHIKAKGWERPIHYHRAKSTCSDVYQVRGVPHVLIVDTEGMIAFKGHPANRPNLKDDLTNLLKGEKLTGEGCGPAAAAEGEEALPEGYAECDAAAIMAQMDAFHNEIGAKLQKDGKESATGMQRNFCVLTFMNSYFPSTGKWAGKYENHRVLVGPQEKIDACKKLIEDNMPKDATYKINEQLHPM